MLCLLSVQVNVFIVGVQPFMYSSPNISVLMSSAQSQNIKWWEQMLMGKILITVSHNLIQWDVVMRLQAVFLWPDTEYMDTGPTR